jgi:hypothetical protein
MVPAIVTSASLKLAALSGEQTLAPSSEAKMAADLLVFVCEGPTCCDKWDTNAPQDQIAKQLAERRLEDRVHLQSEICFGHCRQGANLVTQPFTNEARWRGPDPTVPGARVHHQMSVAQAVLTLVQTLETRPKDDLAVAANPEVA